MLSAEVGLMKIIVCAREVIYTHIYVYLQITH